MDAAARDPRRGQPRARDRAAGKADRHVAGGARRADGRRRHRARCSRRYEPDLPMLFIVSQVGARHDGPGGRQRLGVARRRREVRALLARRPRAVARSRAPRACATAASTPCRLAPRRARDGTADGRSRDPGRSAPSGGTVDGASPPSRPRRTRRRRRDRRRWSARSRSSRSARSWWSIRSSKFMVKATIPLYSKHVIIPNLLDFTHVQNTGAAFGLLNAADFPYKSAVMIGIADARAGRDLALRAPARRARAAVALRAGADPRRRVRQPDRSRDRRLRRGLRRRLLGRGALLGLQRRRRRHHRSGPSSCCSRWSGSDAAMHPILFDFGGFTIYAYGVLLAAAYLLGLQFALVRARARGLDAQRVMDLGIWIIISALVGAKLLLLIVDFKQFTAEPAGAARPGALGRRVLRRPDRRGRRRAALPAPAQAAAVDHHRRVRPGHRARPRRRPPGLPAGGLLLRQADVGAVGDHVPRSRRHGERRARRSACRSIRRSSTKRARKRSSWCSSWCSSAAAGRFPGGRSGATCCSTGSRGSSSSSTAATAAAWCSTCCRRRSSCRSCSCRCRS